MNVRILLNNIGLGLALERPPAGLAVVHVLQLQPEGRYVLLSLQQKDPPPLVQSSGLTDPHLGPNVAPS